MRPGAASSSFSTSPLTRFRWAIASGAGVMGSLAVTTLIVGLLIGLGAVSVGDDPVRPFAGIWVVGAYAAALAGVGIAVGGFVRAGLAAVVTGGLTIGLYLFDLLGALLGLPDIVLDLSPVAHLGRPIAGVWDVPGTVLCVGLAVGGVVAGAFGTARRDVGS